jgi:hypothetical protein
LMTMVLSAPSEAPLEALFEEVPLVVVVAADEEELYFPLPPVVALPEVAALPVAVDPPPPAEDPPPLLLPQPASINASTSVRVQTASVAFRARFIVLSLLPLG